MKITLRKVGTGEDLIVIPTDEKGKDLNPVRVNTLEIRKTGLLNQKAQLKERFDTEDGKLNDSLEFIQAILDFLEGKK